MDCNFTLCKRYLNGNCIKQVGEKCQLEQAKSLIDQLVNSSPYKTSSAEYFYKDLIEEAKQFLKEQTCP